MGYANLVLAGVDAGAPQLVQRLVSYTGTEGIQLFSKLDRTTLQKVLRAAQSGATGQSPEWIEAMNSLKKAAGNDQGFYERLVETLRKAGDRFPPPGGAPELVTEGAPSLKNISTPKSEQSSPVIQTNDWDKTTPSPKSGDPSKLKNVVEEEPDELGRWRWFARFSKDGKELFSGRLRPDGHLEVGWTENPKDFVQNISEIQDATGQKIQKISGNASDGFLKVIEAKEFNADAYINTPDSFRKKWTRKLSTL
jgi:hypothetical protein